jgi:hypothetical protein
MISGESVMTRSPCCALWQVARVGKRRSGLRNHDALCRDSASRRDLAQSQQRGAGCAKVHRSREMVLRGRLFGLWETRSTGGGAFTRRDA